MEVRELRNIREVALDLAPGLNVFVGRNAQGKTTLLEAVGLLARGRSFRTEHTESLIRRGAPGLLARGTARDASRRTALEVEVALSIRRFRVDGQEVGPRSYHGRLEAVVYSTDRLKVVWGPMRERRLFLDRSASALWPAYRQTVRDFEGVLEQRNAALEAGSRDIETWDERFVVTGAALRQRRGQYAGRLRAALAEVSWPRDEAYGLALSPEVSPDGEAAEREALRREIEARRPDDRRARRSLTGPHRDAVSFKINGEEAASGASSGQARSLLLALTLATLAVYRDLRGETAVALLDDLDSELDEDRTLALCREVAGRGQTLVTTAHPAWALRLRDEARLFRVDEGRVTAP